MLDVWTPDFSYCVSGVNKMSVFSLCSVGQVLIGGLDRVLGCYVCLWVSCGAGSRGRLLSWWVLVPLSGVQGPGCAL